MPIYEYECLKEGHRFEVIQKFDEPPVAHCTVCGSAVQKLLSSPAIQFKGSGWYITDYARKGQSDSGKPSTEKATSDSTKSSSDTSKESKTSSTDNKSN